MVVQQPVVADDKRRLLAAFLAHPPPHLHPNGLLFSCDGHQALVATCKVNREQRVGHGAHDSRCGFFWSPHSTSNSHRGGMFPSQFRYFSDLNQNSIDGMVVFVHLSGEVLFRVVRARIGHLLSGVATNFIGFSNAKPTLTRIGFSSDSNGCSRFFQRLQALSLLSENNVRLLEFLNARLESRASIDNPQRLLSFKAESKTIEDGWPTRCNDKIIAIMVVGKTKDHCNTLCHAVLDEGPRLGCLSAKNRWQWTHIVARNGIRIQIIDVFWS